MARLEATLPPPGMRHEMPVRHEALHDDAFESSEVSETDNHALPEAPARKARARSLIKPGRVRPVKA